MTREETLALLNADAPTALENLKKLAADNPFPPKGTDVNNHIHTTYSFSPYSPTAAVYFARMAGLATCGLMDHDSIAGAEEFLAVNDVSFSLENGDMGATIGIECRVSFANSPFASRRINNPDQDGIVYMALHGVPHTQTGRVNEFFAPYRAKRNVRNAKMVAAVNGLMAKYGVTLDFEKDVLPLSNAAKGGSVTERHLSRALSEKLLARYPEGAALVRFLEEDMGFAISAKVRGYLMDETNPFRMYDLLGFIKSDVIGKFYIPATDECPDVRDVLALSEEVGAISAYAYLGDVGDSVTGDKRAQKFEDDYLDELVPFLKELGFRAITYMPSRNTMAQLNRVRALCEQYGLMQISGEDINSPRQSFVCEAQRDPAFAHLITATWALIAHEWRATANPEDGLFSAKSVEKWPSLAERLSAFAAFAERKE